MWPSSELSTLTVTGDNRNRTYGTHEKTVYFAIFTNNIWPYLLWPPVVGRREKNGRKWERSKVVSYAYKTLKSHVYPTLEKDVRKHKRFYLRRASGLMQWPRSQASSLFRPGILNTYTQRVQHPNHSTICIEFWWLYTPQADRSYTDQTDHLDIIPISLFRSFKADRSVRCSSCCRKGAV